MAASSDRETFVWSLGDCFASVVPGYESENIQQIGSSAHCGGEANIDQSFSVDQYDFESYCRLLFTILSMVPTHDHLTVSEINDTAVLASIPVLISNVDPLHWVVQQFHTRTGGIQNGQKNIITRDGCLKIGPTIFWIACLSLLQLQIDAKSTATVTKIQARRIRYQDESIQKSLLCARHRGNSLATM